MYNLIKMEFYKLKRSKAFKNIILFSFIFSIIGIYFFRTLPDAPVSWQAYFINALRDSALNIILIAIFAGLFIGADFSNKTINHEIISGHSRVKIFLSKSIVFFIGSSIISLIYPVTSMFSSMAFSRWTEEFTSLDLIYVLRVLSLYIIINLGVMATCLFIAFIFKDVGKTIGVSIIFLAVGSQLLNNILSKEFRVIGKLHDYVGLGQLNIAIKDIISKSEIVIILLSSLMTLGIILSISYMSFRKTELR